MCVSVVFIFIFYFSSTYSCCLHCTFLFRFSSPSSFHRFLSSFFPSSFSLLLHFSFSFFQGVLTVGALFVVAKAVDETGIVNKVATKILGEPKSLFIAQLRLLVPVAVSSAFMNNTPIVAMMIPVILQWAPKLKRAPSTFLMPLSFASMLGGMCSICRIWSKL